MYVLVASILLYILLVGKLDSPRMSTVKAAAILVTIPFVLALVVSVLENLARGVPPLMNVLTLSRLLTSAVQFFIALGIFHEAEGAGNEYLSFALWGGLGLALIYFVVPMLLQRVFIGLF